MQRFLGFGACVSAVLLVTACTGVHSNLTIDGSQFGPDECRNLSSEELYGVDLRDANGLVLRLAHNVDESVSVVVIDGVHRPQAMTGCARLHLDRGSQNKGDYSLSGSATIDCTSADGATTVKGSTTFDLCSRDF